VVSTALLHKTYICLPASIKPQSVLALRNYVHTNLFWSPWWCSG
jgi:hypothetical protein